jgi:hypothetical protein
MIMKIATMAPYGSSFGGAAVEGEDVIIVPLLVGPGPDGREGWAARLQMREVRFGEYILYSITLSTTNSGWMGCRIGHDGDRLPRTVHSPAR